MNGLGVLLRHRPRSISACGVGANPNRGLLDTRLSLVLNVGRRHVIPEQVLRDRSRLARHLALFRERELVSPRAHDGPALRLGFRAWREALPSLRPPPIAPWAVRCPFTLPFGEAGIGSHLGQPNRVRAGAFAFTPERRSEASDRLGEHRVPISSSRPKTLADDRSCSTSVGRLECSANQLDILLRHSPTLAAQRLRGPRRDPRRTPGRRFCPCAV
jgi:hypothetical protein